MVLQFTVPTKGSDNKGKIYCIFFNPVINEALRRVNNGYSFYDKIKSILVTDSQTVGLMLIFTIQL